MIKLKLLSYIAIALCTTILFSACNNNSAQTDKNQTKKKEYAVITIEAQTATLNIQYPASLQGEQNVEIRPRIDGYIEKILIDEGAVVKKGQILFRLDGAQYEQNVRSAEADIKIAAADVNAAQVQVNKVKHLVEKDIISHYELESAEYTLQSKQAALAQANAKLLNAKTNLSYTVITSPSNGIVGAIPYKAGSLVSSSSAQPLTTVSNISTIYAYFSMNEKDFLSLIQSDNNKPLQQKLKQMKGISLLLADGSNYPHAGRIETVSGIINSQTGSANFRAVFPNTQSHLRSGGSAVVCIPTTIQNAILIPQKATYEIQGKRFVYLVGKDGRLKNTEVNVMPVGIDRFFVVVNGVNAGDNVVIEGVNTLKEKMVIKPKYIASDSIYKNLK